MACIPTIISDWDLCFTAVFWSSLFELLGTRLMMAIAAHHETEGQPERVNLELKDVLRSYAASFALWSKFLPISKFALITQSMLR